MHPHTAYALAAADALRRALTALEQRAREALKDAEAGSSGGEVSIPSQQFGRRSALGVHGDPTAALALGAWAPGGPEPHTALLGEILRELEPAAAELPGAPGMDPLRRIRQAIPAMSPLAAEHTAAALAHLDGEVREWFVRHGQPLPSALQSIAGQCPACRCVALYRTSGWVVCRATGCACAGPGCGCGMDEPTAGVGHIWDRTAGFVTTGLAATR